MPEPWDRCSARFQAMMERRESESLRNLLPTEPFSLWGRWLRSRLRDAMRNNFFLVLACSFLISCSGLSAPSIPELIQNSKPPQDCRNPEIVFDAFQIYAKQVTQTGSHLTAVFEVKNITNVPKSTQNGSGKEPDTVSGLLREELIGPNDAIYTSDPFSVDSGALNPLGGPLQNPGTTLESRITFDAPQAAYVFRLTRIRMNLSPAELPPEVWVCFIPKI
jgi:hypothetical protein